MKKKQKHKRQPPRKKHGSSITFDSVLDGNVKKNLAGDGFTIIKYEITDEPLCDPYLEKLSPAVRERVNELRNLLHRKPKEVIPELCDLLKKYPDFPMLYNYLSVAYSLIDDTTNRDAVLIKCYKKFPDYLFGRINYAQLCLENGETEKIPEIFENKLDLQLLYPQRTQFHISEYISFTGVIGLYYLKIGEREIAEHCYKALKQIDPRDRITKRLKKALNPPLIIRLLLWLHQKKTGRVVTPEELERIHTTR
jgi:tetratricopeptide (TPR) repeat protein